MRWFSKRAVEDAISDISGSSRSTVVNMPPHLFLLLAQPGYDEGKASGISALVRTVGFTGFSSLPYLNFINNGDGTGRVTGHEGRHRVRAMAEAGATRVPVRVWSGEYGEGDAVRWRRPWPADEVFPRVLVSEDGRAKVRACFFPLPPDVPEDPLCEGLPWRRKPRKRR